MSPRRLPTTREKDNSPRDTPAADRDDRTWLGHFSDGGYHFSGRVLRIISPHKKVDRRTGHEVEETRRIGREAAASADCSRVGDARSREQLRSILVNVGG